MVPQSVEQFYRLVALQFLAKQLCLAFRRDYPLLKSLDLAIRARSPSEEALDAVPRPLPCAYRTQHIHPIVYCLGIQVRHKAHESWVSDFPNDCTAFSLVE